MLLVSPKFILAEAIRKAERDSIAAEEAGDAPRLVLAGDRLETLRVEAAGGEEAQPQKSPPR